MKSDEKLSEEESKVIWELSKLGDTSLVREAYYLRIRKHHRVTLLRMVHQFKNDLKKVRQKAAGFFQKNADNGVLAPEAQDEYSELTAGFEFKWQVCLVPVMNEEGTFEFKILDEYFPVLPFDFAAFFNNTETHPLVVNKVSTLPGRFIIVDSLMPDAMLKTFLKEMDSGEPKRTIPKFPITNDQQWQVDMLLVKNMPVSQEEMTAFVANIYPEMFEQFRPGRRKKIKWSFKPLNEKENAIAPFQTPQDWDGHESEKGYDKEDVLDKKISWLKDRMNQLLPLVTPFEK
jgi:hypothetical protein